MRSLSSQQAAASSALRWTVTECSGRSADLAPSSAPAPVLRQPNSGISIYPNPVQDQLNIDIQPGLSAGGEVTLRITDVMGREMKCSGFTAGTGTQVLSMNDLRDGIYLVRVFSGNKLMMTERIVKSN